MYTANNVVNAKLNFNIQSFIIVMGYFKKLIVLHIFVIRKMGQVLEYAFMEQK